MPRDFSRSRAAREHVNVWRSRIARSRAIWDRCDPDGRRELTDMVGNLRFPLLVFRDESDAEHNPQADQYDLNLLLRMFDKYRAHVGDEEPEVRWDRSRDGQEVAGEAVDRAVMASLAESGAPDELQETVGPVCTQGLSILYCEIPDLPALDEILEAQKGAEQVAAEAAVGAAEPGRLQDHLEMVGRLAREAHGEDAGVLRHELSTSRPGEADFERAMDAAVDQAEAHEEEQEAKVPLYWRGDKLKARWVELAYGPDVLWDMTTPRLKDKRWVAIRRGLPVDEARAHPSFRKSVREKLVATPFELAKGEKPVEAHEIGGDDPEAENGIIHYWYVLDRKWGTHHYIPDTEDKYLEVDERYPYVGRDGKGLFPSVGEHPGFFPIVPFWGKKRIANDEFKSLPIPLLQPGLKSQKILTKIASYHLRQIRTHTSVQYEHAPNLEPEHLDAIRRNDDGAMIEANPELWQKGEASVRVIPKGTPSRELARALDQEIARFSILMNFPLSELTSQPVADTATQEEMALGAGNLGVLEVLRGFQHGYAYVAFFQQEILRRLYPPEMLEDLVGAEDAEIVRASWGAAPPLRRLPTVRIAAHSRDRNERMLRAKQGLDLHERAKMEVNPVTGLPRVDSLHILQEVSRMLEFGKLPDYVVSEEDKIAFMRAQIEGQEGGESGRSGPGSGRSPTGQPAGREDGRRSRRERAGRRGNRNGRARGVPQQGSDQGKVRDFGR